MVYTITIKGKKSKKRWKELVVKELKKRCSYKKCKITKRKGQDEKKKRMLPYSLFMLIMWIIYLFL